MSSNSWLWSETFTSELSLMPPDGSAARGRGRNWALSATSSSSRSGPSSYMKLSEMMVGCDTASFLRTTCQHQAAPHFPSSIIILVYSKPLCVQVAQCEHTLRVTPNGPCGPNTSLAWMSVLHNRQSGPWSAQTAVIVQSCMQVCTWPNGCLPDDSCFVYIRQTDRDSRSATLNCMIECL